MQLKEVFTKEQSRKEMVDYRTIYLIPEGTFYRAYEWSAWLCHRYVSQFKPTHRLLKNAEDSVVFVGFPMTSLERHTLDGATVAEQEDKTLAVVLPETLFGETTTEQLQTDLITMPVGTNAIKHTNCALKPTYRIISKTFVKHSIAEPINLFPLLVLLLPTLRSAKYLLPIFGIG